MSPVRKFSESGADYFDAAPKKPVRWGLPLVSVLTALVIVAAITASTIATIAVINAVLITV